MEGNKFVVFGVGRYGRQIALKLAKKGAEVYCFDFSEDKIEGLKDDVALAVTMDCTLKKNLLSQSIEDVDAAVIAIGENFEATILTCVHLIVPPDFQFPTVFLSNLGKGVRTPIFILHLLTKIFFHHSGIPIGKISQHKF